MILNSFMLSTFSTFINISNICGGARKRTSTKNASYEQKNNINEQKIVQNDLTRDYSDTEETNARINHANISEIVKTPHHAKRYNISTDNIIQIIKMLDNEKHCYFLSPKIKSAFTQREIKFQKSYVKQIKDQLIKLKKNCYKIDQSKKMKTEDLFSIYMKLRRNSKNFGICNYPNILIQTMLNSGMELNIVINIVKNIFIIIHRFDAAESLFRSIIICTFDYTDFYTISKNMLEIINNQNNVCKKQKNMEHKLFKSDDVFEKNIITLVEELVYNCITDIEYDYCTHKCSEIKLTKRSEKPNSEWLNPVFKDMVAELTEFILFNKIVDHNAKEHVNLLTDEKKIFDEQIQMFKNNSKFSNQKSVINSAAKIEHSDESSDYSYVDSDYNYKNSELMFFEDLHACKRDLFKFECNLYRKQQKVYKFERQRNWQLLKKFRHKYRIDRYEESVYGYEDSVFRYEDSVDRYEYSLAKYEHSLERCKLSLLKYKHFTKVDSYISERDEFETSYDELSSENSEQSADWENLEWENDSCYALSRQYNLETARNIKYLFAKITDSKKNNTEVLANVTSNSYIKINKEPKEDYRLCVDKEATILKDLKNTESSKKNQANKSSNISSINKFDHIITYTRESETELAESVKQARENYLALLSKLLQLTMITTITNLVFERASSYLQLEKEDYREKFEAYIIKNSFTEKILQLLLKQIQQCKKCGKKDDLDKLNDIVTAEIKSFVESSGNGTKILLFA